MKNNAPITKITRPGTKGTFYRRGLFRRLARSDNNLVWITGPPGSGKTTLVSSYIETSGLPCLWYRIDGGDTDVSTFFYYMGLAAKKAASGHKRPMPLLTPEYAFGVPVFSKRYFEGLFIRLKPPFVLVFDNYQDVPPESAFHEVMLEGLSALPEWPGEGAARKGIRAIIISRSEPPAGFARLRAAGKVITLGWDEIRFTQQEYKEIIRLHGPRGIADDIISGVYHKTQGWIAGLMLLLERARYGEIAPELINRLPELSQKAVFDYFAGETLGKMDKETQSFLIRTALLPEMTASMAGKLTGSRRAGRLLSELSRNHFFTEKRQTGEPAYRYHSLFREFLLARLRESAGSGEIRLLQNRSASVLEEAGQIEDAASAYRETKNWERLVPLVLGHAPSLLKQGRNITLEGWLRGMPPNVLESDPWLLYWLGMSLMGYNFSAARTELEGAFARFTETGGRLGMVLSWSYIVEAVIFEWDDFHPLDGLISVYFERIEEALPSTPPSVQSRAMSAIGQALSFRRPGHPQITGFFEKAWALAGQSGDMDIGLQALSVANIHYHWAGDFTRCNALIEQARGLRSSSAASQMFQLLSDVTHAGRHLWDLSSLEEADRRISGALEFGAKTGLHFWDHMLYALGIYGSLMKGDMAKARQYLEKMGAMLIPVRKELHVQYHFMNCSYQFLMGDFPAAFSAIGSGLKLSGDTGYVFPGILMRYAMAQVLHALKNARARQYLEWTLRLAVQAGSTVLEFGCRLAMAQFALDGGQEKEGMELLREALSMGRRHGYYCPLWWCDNAVMSRLSAKALQNGIEPGYVKELIRMRSLAPEDTSMHIEDWPWPLKIYTLGRFELIKDGKPLLFKGKVQQKPLEMLKALISYGGKAVSEERLSDALWPEAEGNTAHASFSTTLHRLRRLTGNEKAIQLQDGRVTLDRRCCWVDIWAFECIVENALRLPQSPQIKSIESALPLYAGHFLPADDKPWSVSARERIKSRFLSCIRTLAGHYEKTANPEKAVELIHRGLEADALAEDLYRGLMTCYSRMGRRPDALSAYERCRQELSSAFGVSPSPETERLKEDIQKN
ncbi:MAG: BTAD domain-containing putative transcriptional regulator [Nitrospiraceae bacterium]|nr:BTAD domain-containing putative transcriptional regulator [Nitrospiraceae bacterium]